MKPSLHPETAIHSVWPRDGSLDSLLPRVLHLKYIHPDDPPRARAGVSAITKCDSGGEQPTCPSDPPKDL